MDKIAPIGVRDNGYRLNNFKDKKYIKEIIQPFTKCEMEIAMTKKRYLTR